MLCVAKTKKVLASRSRRQGFTGGDNHSMDPLDIEQHGLEMMLTNGMSFQSCEIDTFLPTGHDSPRPATAELY